MDRLDTTRSRLFAKTAKLVDSGQSERVLETCWKFSQQIGKRLPEASNPAIAGFVARFFLPVVSVVKSSRSFVPLHNWLR
jgi:hypothetical protein